MAEVGIFVGTMYGNSLLVAEEAQTILGGLGHQAKVFEDPTVADWESYTGKYALVVTSTTVNIVHLHDELPHACFYTVVSHNNNDCQISRS